MIGINKKWLMRVLVIIVGLVLIFSPYLLAIDIDRFGPFVLVLWVTSIAYYLFFVKKNRPDIDWEGEKKDDEENENNENENGKEEENKTDDEIEEGKK